MTTKFRNRRLVSTRLALSALVLATGATVGSGCGERSCEEALNCAPGSAAGLAGGAGSSTNGGSDGSGATGGSGGNGAVDSGGRSSGGRGGSGAKGGGAGSEVGGGEAGSGAGGTEAGSGNAGGDGGRADPSNPPPTVVSVTPDDLSAGIEPDAVITLKFSEKLAPASVTSDTLRLLLDGNPVPGAVTYSGVTATFTPDSRLVLFGDYTVSVSQDVTDVAGARLADDFSSEFAIRDGVWGTPVELPSYPSAASDAEGNTIVAWVLDDTVTARVFHPGIGFDAPVNIASCPDCYSPRVAMNANGDGVVGYYSYDDKVIAARQYRNGVWDAESLTVLEDGNALFDVSMAPTGEAHFVAILGTTLVSNHTDSSGKWTNPGTVNDATEGYGNSTSAPFSWAWAPNGNAFLGWTDPLTSGQYAQSQRFTTYNASQGVWNSSVRVPGTAASNGYSYTQPAVATDASGNAIAVWSGSDGGSGALDGIFASRFTAAAAWSTAAPIDNLGKQFRDNTQTPVVVADDSDFVAVWLQAPNPDLGKYNLYSNRWHDGAWGEAELRSDGLSAVQVNLVGLTGDASRNLLLTWNAQVGATTDLEALYTRYAHGKWSEAKNVFEDIASSDVRTTGGANGVTALMTQYVPSGGSTTNVAVFFE